MFKLIILNNNLETIKNICNQILSEISEVQLSGFGTTLEEFDTIFQKVNPDILLMNYSDYINSKYTIKTKPKKFKIIFCDSGKTPKSNLTHLYISSNASLPQIKKSIKKFIYNKNKILMQKKIVKCLKLFQFDFKLVGTTFLLESILYCYENREDYVFENLERNVYPEVAKIFDVTSEHIKWTISRSVKNVNSHLHTDIRKQLSHKFDLDFYDKITPKQILCAIVNNLD